HRHTFHHTHHPLSTHLPVFQRQRKRVHSTDRRRKKKRKKKKTSLPPSDVTPTIHEVDEEEAESDTEGRLVTATPTELPDIQPQFSFGSQEDLEEPPPPATVHMENEEHPVSSKAAVTLIKEAARNGRVVVSGDGEKMVGGEAPGTSTSAESEPYNSTSNQSWLRRKPIHHRLLAAQRSNYDLRERICIGSMTALETAVYQQVPTDEAEAQMLDALINSRQSRFPFTGDPASGLSCINQSRVIIDCLGAICTLKTMDLQLALLHGEDMCCILSATFLVLSD
ncbi:hypothetical protein GOODEAATRI_012884, partial [Goodea atripinnis]